MMTSDETGCIYIYIYTYIWVCCVTTKGSSGMDRCIRNQYRTAKWSENQSSFQDCLVFNQRFNDLFFLILMDLCIYVYRKT